MDSQADKKTRREQLSRERAHRRRVHIISWVVVPLLAVLLAAGAGGAYYALVGSRDSGETAAGAGGTFFGGGGEAEDLVIEIDRTPKSLEVVMVGDVLLHQGVQDSCVAADGSYDYDPIFANTKDAFRQADIAIVNQEVIIGGESLGVTGWPIFNAAYSLCDSLYDAGFNVVCHATNHAYDMKETGILNCLNAWKTRCPQMNVLGIHEGTTDTDPLCLMEFGDVTIGILNYTAFMNEPMDLKESTVDMLTKDGVKADLARAGELADFIIVVPHWGEEYKTYASDEQKEWAQFFLENGVDLVIGAHPHVIEPVEWLKDDDGHKMLCYYSIGNFVEYPSASHAGLYKYAVGVMADVTLSIEDGEVSVSDYGVEPTIAQMGDEFGGTTVYFLKDYNQELLEENVLHEKDSAFTIENCESFLKEVLGDVYQEGS